jgi:hypothetical protein
VVVVAGAVEGSGACEVGELGAVRLGGRTAEDDSGPTGSAEPGRVVITQPSREVDGN